MSMLMALIGVSIQLLLWGTIIIGCVRWLKAQQYTREDYQKGLRVLGFGMVIIVVICLNGNSNQNPNSFMDRMFRPISASNWMFNYAGLISGIVGEFSIQEDLREDSPRTGVIKIRVSERDLFVKMYNRLSRWNPEVYAYENWIPLIPQSAPELIGKFNNGEIYGIIMTALEGKTINEWQMTDQEKLVKAYFQAGEALRELHNHVRGHYFGIPKVAGEPFESRVQENPVEYIRDSLKMFLEKGMDKKLFSQQEQELVKWCIEEADIFEESYPVPTHWDYSPNNWIVNEQGEFKGVIDFENMLWGIDFDSFGMILERYTHDNPELMKAFLEGYQFEYSDKNTKKLKILATKIAIADIAQGYNAPLERPTVFGRKLLQKLVEV